MANIIGAKWSEHNKWCRPIEQELDLIDLQCLLDSDVFAPQGSHPLCRIRASGNPMSSRTAVTGLPMAMYDRAWVAGLTQRQVEVLDVSPVNFW